MKEKIASISIDLERLKHAFLTFNCPNIPHVNVIYEKALPRILNLLESYGIRGTFFVIGEDLVEEQNAELIKEIAARGHEIANHTYYHFWKGNINDDEYILREIVKNEELIEDITGRKVRGFRAPFWAINKKMLEILKKRNYLYDSSVFPSVLSIMGSFMIRKMSGKRVQRLGNPLQVFSPNKPYFHDLSVGGSENGLLVELPISQIPYARLPFYSTSLFKGNALFFRYGYELIKRKCNFLNFQFHGIDFIDIDTDQIAHLIPKALYKHPSFQISYEERQKKILNLMQRISKDFSTLTLEEVAMRFQKKNKNN